MCGIFGAISFKNFFSKDDFDIFVSLTDLVSYRGPDAFGYEALNTKEPFVINKEKFNVFMGHRRLSIIDLSENGNQPFSDKNDLWIVFNGEIFNYIELKKDLKKKGHIFKTETDTEVILKIYREYGEKGFTQLNGMWAFAIVDVSNQKVVLSRDRFSIKPLYFYKYDNQLYFSSEIKQLLPIAKKKDINMKVMFAYLKQGLLDFNHETFFKDIYKVKPMHNVIINLTNQEIVEKKYWDYFNEVVPDKEDEIIEQFREIFIDSVKIRLRSDVPVGCLLSGGLDSSSLAVIANKTLNNDINCFSVVSDDKKYSEEKFINIVRNKTNIKVTKLFFKNDAAWDYLDKVIWHNDEPHGGFSVVAQNQILELIRKNSDIKVILSGQGGDEILCGYRKFFFFFLMEEIKSGNVFNSFRNIIGSLIHRTVLWQSSIFEAKRYLQILHRKNFDPLSSILKLQYELEPIWAFKNLKSRQCLDIDKYSVPTLAHYEDRNSMAYSLEIRLPFLDHRLVNFILNTPSSLKIKNGWTKYILRKSIVELPKEIAWRRDKQGFITPEEKWIKYDFKEEIIDLFSASKLHDFDIINKAQFLEKYKTFLMGNNIVSYWDVSRFLMAELWVRKFF